MMTNLALAIPLLRNLPLDARIPFEQYGPAKDVYLPNNYYTGFILIKEFLLEQGLVVEAVMQHRHCKMIF